MSKRFLCLFVMISSLCAVSGPLEASSTMMATHDKNYKEYTDFFEKIYQTFEANYYLPPDRAVYNHFLEKFNTKIYSQLKSEGKSDNYVRWRSTWYLVDALKSKDDRFFPYILNKIEIDQACFLGMTEYSNFKQNYFTINISTLSYTASLISFISYFLICRSKLFVSLIELLMRSNLHLSFCSHSFLFASIRSFIFDEL